MKETLALYKIELHIGTPNNPNSMGLIERFHSSIIEIYRIAKYEHKFTDAATVMTYAIMGYNNTIHSVTDLTPFEALFGHIDSNSVFNINFEKQYTQKLIKEHVERTKFLYKYLSNKMKSNKETVRNKLITESSDTNLIKDMKIGKEIFTKLVNKRRGKDKPCYEKAVITGETSRNVIPVSIRQRQTRVPLRNVRRPPVKK